MMKSNTNINSFLILINTKPKYKNLQTKNLHCKSKHIANKYKDFTLSWGCRILYNSEFN